MPRDGSHIYTVPGGTDGVPDQPVYSTPYNGFVHDVEQDLNTPRPILAGGTAAINARDAMINLSGELSSQLVDNYNSYPFVAGSFYSLAGATGGPTAGAYAGICYIGATGAEMTLEARSIDDATNPGKLYVRQKRAGVWGAWTSQVGPVTDLDAGLATKVSKTGDVMSGPLAISYTGAPTTGFTVYGSGGKYVGFDGTNIVTSGDTKVQGDLATTGKITADASIYSKGNVTPATMSPSAALTTLAATPLAI
jgi:hypothetical protein